MEAVGEALPAETTIRSVNPVTGGTAASRPRFDLSNNELTQPPLPSVLTALQGSLAGLARYPDPAARELVGELARHLDIPADMVVLGPGSAGVLQQLLLALCRNRDEVVYAWPGFDAYPMLVALSGATGVQVPLTATGEQDLDGIQARVHQGTRVVILCSPHNPTGTVIDRDRLQRFLGSLPPHIVVVLDEAYVEFERGGDPDGRPAMLSDHANVILLRTFSKAYGLAGLRVGYAAGPSQLISAVRKSTLPFGVTRLAEQAAIISLRSRAELTARMAEVITARQQLSDRLRALRLPVLPSGANFVWLPLASSAAEFAATASAAGVKVRTCPGHGVRVSVGEAEAHRMLVAALDAADRTDWR